MCSLRYISSYVLAHLVSPYEKSDGATSYLSKLIDRYDSFFSKSQKSGELRAVSHHRRRFISHVTCACHIPTRIGFVLNHKKHMEDLQKAQDDTMHQFYIETQKEPRNWRIISRLNYDIRENVKLLSELGLGTPIIAAIKSKLEKARAVQHDNNNRCDIRSD